MAIGKVSVVYQKDVETLTYDWGRIWMLCTKKEQGSKGMSFGIVDSKPGGSHELHSHAKEAEIIYVVSGTGKLLIKGKVPQRVKPGAMIYVPAGVAHATVNVGKGLLRVIIVYSPVGPEVALRNMEGCKVVPSARRKATGSRVR
jgi:oxalate decarboxylase/phosphoglucose isomerase-like protein (cupin superfamily)